MLSDALAGSDRPLVIASGLFGIAPGRVVIEQDGIDPAKGTEGPVKGAADRMANARYTASLASQGVRSSVLRLPSTHGDGTVTPHQIRQERTGVSTPRRRNGLLRTAAPDRSARHSVDRQRDVTLKGEHESMATSRPFTNRAAQRESMRTHAKAGGDLR